MSEFEDMLGRILGDPAEMEKIAGLAAQLMGGDGGKSSEGGEAPDMGKMLSGLFSGELSSGGDKAALVEALGPYLKPQRRKKLEKALRIGRLAGLAERALKGMGDGDVPGV